MTQYSKMTSKRAQYIGDLLFVLGLGGSIWLSLHWLVGP